jgi:hypothetical protein
MNLLQCRRGHNEDNLTAKSICFSHSTSLIDFTWTSIHPLLRGGCPNVEQNVWKGVRIGILRKI